MHSIRLENLTLTLAGRPIFGALSWGIGDSERIGLVGPNGAGKSSLLKLIKGEIRPDSGAVIVGRGVRVGYLPQEVELPTGSTLYQQAAALPPRLREIETQLTQIENQLAKPEVYTNPAALARLLDKQAAILDQYTAAGGPAHEGRAKEMLAWLGFSPDDYDLPAEALSGGQKKLAALIRLALEGPEVLLLDEPDNHLDLEAKRRLEGFLRRYSGTVILVSHDRYLLDEVVTGIAELEGGRLTLYTGNYTAYTHWREAARLRQQQLYTTQQKEISRIEEAIKRFEHWAHVHDDEAYARKARHHRRRLEKMDKIERISEARRMDLQLDGWRGSQKALEVLRLGMEFGDDLLFLDLDLLIRHGERVGLVGPNGAGKSVLFKLILGEMTPLEGEIRLGPSTRLGYYAQEHQALATWLPRTPLDLIRDTAPLDEGEAVAFLLKFLFKYEQVRLPIQALSGGERSRLQLARLMLTKPNLLLLDEPTNNLDIPAVEVLEAALEEFEGALLVISHDRYFLDTVVNRVVELDNGALTDYAGNYTDYLRNL